jgi:hypothetical protein
MQFCCADGAEIMLVKSENMTTSSKSTDYRSADVDNSVIKINRGQPHKVMSAYRVNGVMSLVF